VAAAAVEVAAVVDASAVVLYLRINISKNGNVKIFFFILSKCERNFFHCFLH
jgi:hypothetical protein